jgi:5-formyltetrahydrofolate cyclo-ligase
MTQTAAVATIDDKPSLRAAMRARRDALAPDVVAAASRAAVAHALALPVWDRAKIVGLYQAMAGELDPGALADALRARGVVVCLPRVDPPRRRGLLRFLRVDAEGELVAGPFGLREPPPDAPELALSTIDVFVTPGLAFDAHGARLGFGRGHYDVTLAAAPQALRVGFCHAFQVVPAVPESSGDERVDVLVTENGAHATNARAGRLP